MTGAFALPIETTDGGGWSMLSSVPVAGVGSTVEPFGSFVSVSVTVNVRLLGGDGAVDLVATLTTSVRHRRRSRGTSR